MTPLHTRAFCDECGMRLAVVEISPAFFLCEQCNSVTSIASSASDVNVTAALPPGSAVTINSEIPRGSHDVARGPGPSSVTGMSEDRPSAGGEHEAVAPLSIGSCGKSAACETSLTAADLNVESFSSLGTSSGIGSARETSAMLHPGAVDGSTTQLAGRDSGDRSERRSTNSDPVPSPSRGPETSSPAVPVALSFEAEVAALELKWMRAGIIMNAHTLAVMHLSRNNAAEASS